MTTSTSTRTIFATLALLLTACAAQQQAYIIFRNPDANADVNVVTDISRIANPQMINQIRNAVINSVESSADQAFDAVDQVRNTATNAVQNVAQNAQFNANANANANAGPANIAFQARSARQLQSGISGLGGLLALPLSLLSLPLSLLGGLTGGK